MWATAYKPVHQFCMHGFFESLRAVVVSYSTVQVTIRHRGASLLPPPPRVKSGNYAGTFFPRKLYKVVSATNKKH